MTRVLLFFLAVLLLERVFRRLRRQVPGRAPVPAAGPIRELVQDPACGVFLPRERAYAVAGPSGTRHFCSQACHRRFLSAPSAGSA